MSKQSGLGFNLYVGGVDVSGDIGSVAKMSGNQTTQDVTGMDKFAMERLGLLRSGDLDFTAFYNPTRAHPVFSALPTADQMTTLACGTAFSSPAMSMIGKQVNYDPNREKNGALTVAISAQSNAFGLEWGVQLTAGKRSDTTATNGTGVDTIDVSTAFGWQAYLQVFSFTGTSVTVTIQDSADNASFAGLAGGGGVFTAATGITTQRITGLTATDTVRRYVRAITTGTFSQATFNVVFVKNQTLVAF